MGAADYLTIINIVVAGLGVLVAALGVAFGVFAYIEWRRLANLRKDLSALEKRIRKEHYQSAKAMHRVIASYGIKDIDARISLLKTALAEFPEAFNAWNTLGYAYLEKGDAQKAIDAFKEAVKEHPDDKAGYCDLAYAYLQAGKPDKAIEAARKAIEIDRSARADLLADSRFSQICDSLMPD